MAGPEISQNAQIYPNLEAAAEPPSKRMRVCDEPGSQMDQINETSSTGEAPISSDNGDSGFHDIGGGGRCDDSSASESESGALLSSSTGGASPLAWISAKMQAGADPRPLLEKLLDVGVKLPADLDRMTMWNIIIELLDEHVDRPMRQRLPNVSTIDHVLKLLKTCKRIVVLTGAGVSVSCGIPDFRSKDGIYARLRQDFPSLPDPQAMFDMRFFRQDPRPFFKFAHEIYPGQFEPSASHHFIRALERRGQLLRNYTQNIDTLEYACGIEKVIACHGGFSTATCTLCGYKVTCEALREDIFAQRVPLCPKCPQPKVQHWEEDETSVTTPDHSDQSADERSDLFGAPMMAVMKPDIVFFGEGLPKEFHRQIAEDEDVADLLIVMGSSLRVRPVASIPYRMDHSIPQILINREPLRHMSPFDVELLGDCDVIIRELCTRLGGDWMDEEWLKPPAGEAEHPYPIVEPDPQGLWEPKSQIYRLNENAFAFPGADFQAIVGTSDDEDDDSSASSSDGEDGPDGVEDADDDDDDDCSDSELIEFLVDSLVNQVAEQNLDDDENSNTSTTR